MALPIQALHPLGNPLDDDPGLGEGRIHLGITRSEDHVGTRRLRGGEVAIEIARVPGEIVRVVELERVDVYGHHHGVAQTPGSFDERAMAGMK